MWKVSTVIALAPTYVCHQHLLTAAGRTKALKALSAPFLNPKSTARWLQCLHTNDLARRLFRRSPRFVFKPLVQYLSTTYQFADRVRCLATHYEFSAQQIADAQLESIYFGDGLTLAEFQGNSGTSYRVILSSYSDTHNEGEMVLKIETLRAEVICFAIFSVGSSIDGRLRIELGSIQGARKCLDPNVTRVAVKDFHSMRPKHLLMVVLCSLAQNWNIRSIVCVSTQTQLSGSSAFFYADYDSLWEELGGQRDSLGFYNLPSQLLHRAARKSTDKHANRHRRRTKLKADIAKMLQNVFSESYGRLVARNETAGSSRGECNAWSFQKTGAMLPISGG